MWRQLAVDRGADHSALGFEFTSHLNRNPEARQRVVAKRTEVVETPSGFIIDGLERLGATISISPSTFARVLIATTDSAVLGARLDDVDLYRPPLEMHMSVIKLP